MKKILLTLGLTIAAMAMSFNGISQTTDAKVEVIEVTSSSTETTKKACCKKGTSKAECAKMKASSKKSCSGSKKACSKSSAVAGTKQEAKATAGKSCSKGAKKGACCKSKLKATGAKLEKQGAEIKAN